MKHLTFLIATVSLMLHGCSKADINVQIPESPRSIVVEGYLTPGYPAEITLTESNTLNDDLVLLAIWNARATISTDTGTMTGQNILYKNSDRRVVVNYVFGDTIKENAGSFFDLNITTKDGKLVQASTKTVAPVSIEKVELNDDNIIVHHNLANDASKYFWLYFANYKKDELGIRKSSLYDQNGSSGTSCVMPLSGYKNDADSLVLTLYHIQKDYYDYLNSIQNSSSAFVDPLLNPEAIKSNIGGGTGIFTYYTFDKFSLRLR